MNTIVTKQSLSKLIALLTATACLLGLNASSIAATTTIGDVTRVKGQETITLHGIGIVVGLPGTGDGEGPATQAIAQAMKLLGHPVGKLENLNSVAQVYVTAQVDPSGGRAGGRVSATVSSMMGAKSLAGGTLLACALVGPRPGDDRVFATAEGTMTIENAATTTVGRIHDGARFVRDIPSGFQEQGVVTLVIDSKHAGFSTAQEIEYAINEDKEFEGQNLAKAVDAKTVLVKIPDSYRETVVLFVSALTSIPLDSLPRERRVVINEQSGTIIIGDRVEILPVAIAHKNLTIDIGGEQQSQFVPLNPSADTATESLKALVNALNALRVTPADKIEIIKRVDRAGALYGKLIID